MVLNQATRTGGEGGSWGGRRRRGAPKGGCGGGGLSVGSGAVTHEDDVPRKGACSDELHGGREENLLENLRRCDITDDTHGSRGAELAAHGAAHLEAEESEWRGGSGEEGGVKGEAEERAGD